MIAALVWANAVIIVECWQRAWRRSKFRVPERGRRFSLRVATKQHGHGVLGGGNLEVISQLKELHAGLAVEISDFSVERAQAVKRLYEEGIPLTAWLVMSREQGHYLNGFNAPEAEQRFTEFEQWTRVDGLRWGAVGLDIELNFDQLKEVGRHKAQLVWLLTKRFFDYGQVERGREEYAALIRRIQAAGYPSADLPDAVSGRGTCGALDAA